MVLRFAHWIASHAQAYDLIQIAAGRGAVQKRIAKQVDTLPNERYVLDVGGGTGAARRLWHTDTRYICLDNEFPKLQGFRRAAPTGLALLGDATAMPLATASVDATICTMVSHHLSE